MIPLSKKVLEKHRLEIFELHQRVCKSYLVQKGLTYKARNQFFKLYSLTVTENNIEIYFFIPINLFVQALVKGTLPIFFKYLNPELYVRKNRRKSIHRKV